MTLNAEKIYLLNKKVTLWQPVKGFRASIDSVLAAAACPVKSRETLLDMGCGAGNITFSILWRVPDAIVTGIDIQADYVTLAEQNKELNNAAETVKFIHADITEFDTGETVQRFDHIVTNPPYLETGKHLHSPAQDIATARGHNEKYNNTTIKDWLNKAHSALKSGGSLTIIHRADMTDQIIRCLGKRFGATEIIPIWPKSGKDAKRVIIRTIKDRKTPCRLHTGLIMHKDDGSYTKAADKILRDGERLL